MNPVFCVLFLDSVVDSQVIPKLCDRHISLLIASKLWKTQLIFTGALAQKDLDFYILQCRLMCLSHVALVCFSSHLMNCLFVWCTPLKGLSDQPVHYFRWMMNNVKQKEDFKINGRHQSWVASVFWLCPFIMVLRIEDNAFNCMIHIGTTEL